MPIVEPEVLMDGDHTIERCDRGDRADAARGLRRALSTSASRSRASLLKPNMVISGKDCPTQASADEVAEWTLACFRETVPAAVPGIVFLSGGQSDEQASENLNAINPCRGPRPWVLSSRTDARCRRRR